MRAYDGELTPRSARAFASARTSRREAEAATLRAALQSAFGGAPDGSGAAVDLARLCVARARHAWELRVHVAIMAAGDGAHNACGGLGGGMLACASAAVRAALSTAAIPRAVAVAAEGENGTGGAEVEVEIEDGEEVDPLVVASMPVVLTAALLDATAEGEGEGEGEGSGAVVVVDPTEAEEGCARATLSVAVLEGGQVCWERYVRARARARARVQSFLDALFLTHAHCSPLQALARRRTRGRVWRRVRRAARGRARRCARRRGRHRRAAPRR